MTLDMEDNRETVETNNQTMLTEESDIAENSLEPKKEFSDVNHCESESNGKRGMENGISYGNPGSSDHEELLKVVIELRSENEFLKSQLNNFTNLQQGSNVASDSQGGGLDTAVSENLKEFERIESLNKELQEERQTRFAAEEALRHLQTLYADADAKVLDLSQKLAEAQQKLDQEIKEREGKYSELDSKFSRLHKRAKQRIQDIQKEKDDLEARYRELNDTAEKALSQQKALEQELERSRQQANEALKAMDGDRQQLRSANNTLRDTIEELRRSLQPKESEIEGLQQSLLEKDLMLEDMRGLLQAGEEKRQASMAELSAKHQKNMESLEAQLNDALSDRGKATQTISSLQVLVAEKESKIAEMDAASTGEAARLRAAVETVKGELLHLKEKHEKEKESWETACQALEVKLETAENNCIRAEIEAAKLRSQMESEASTQTRILSTRDSELFAAKEEISRLEKEFSSYKVRAHALLQKKEAELAAAKDSEQLKTLEEALKEAEEERSLANSERDRILQELKDARASHDEELQERNTSLENAKQQIKNIEIKLDAANSHYQREKEAWGSNLQTIEETWRIRCEALKAQNEASSAEDIRRELEELKLRYKKLKEEHDSFRDLADRMMEEKDSEISRLLDDNKNLRRSLESKPSVNHHDQYDAGIQKRDTSSLSPSAAEQQILLLARQQAQREEELAQSERHILALQEEIEELEHENRLHSQQVAILKTELRNMERTQKREGVDMTYLKNVILKLLETGEVEALLPVVGMLLQFSPEEMQKCQQAYCRPSDVSTTTNEASGSGLSLFSRFSFT